MPFRRILVLGLLGTMLLAACGATQQAGGPTPTAPPTAAPAATSAPSAAPAATSAPSAAPAATSAPSAAPAATSAPTVAAATAAPEQAGVPEGRTPEGYHVLGRADAPVTLVMYSDFL